MLTDVKLQHWCYRDAFEASKCYCITRQIYSICACLELRDYDAGGPAERAAGGFCCCVRCGGVQGLMSAKLAYVSLQLDEVLRLPEPLPSERDVQK